MERPSSPPASLPGRRVGKHADGRDELNLADFPISVLQRRQPVGEGGRKLDTVVYYSSRYDVNSHRRVPQKVTLTTSSQYGLPTPADENVVLALLYVAKKHDDFTEPKVFFSPRQLFGIMSWSPNSRSYQRLRDVLRRLKALTLIYENAWWDAAGGEYEEEFGTGIVSEYHLVRPSKVRTKPDVKQANWVQWAPRFYESLRAGNLKRLNLDELFQLRLPIAQRMYRFLDKRFYQSGAVEFDVRDFALGHLGMTDADNVAHLKQRLAPALAELEGIGFIESADTPNRYEKVGAGVWRIRFRKGPGRLPEVAAGPTSGASNGNGTEPAGSSLDRPAEQQIVADFYRRWTGDERRQPTDRELAQAGDLIARHGLLKSQALIPLVVDLLKRRWPTAKAFGAIDRYIEDAVAEFERRQRERQQEQRQREERRENELKRHRYEQARAEFRSTWLPVWKQLPASEQEAIRQQVLAKHDYLLRLQDRSPQAIEERCLQELARRFQPPKSSGASINHA